MKYTILGLIAVFSSAMFFSPALAAQNSEGNSVISSGVSQNWAGYYAALSPNTVATGGGYTSVSGSWTVPFATAATPASALSGDATWVGIGGITSTDLIQAGTEGLSNSLGQMTYSAWYEALPGVSQTVPLSINPGDTVTVSLSEPAKNEWYIAFTDSTTGKSYDTSMPYVSTNSSVEWIEEMPSETVNGNISDTFVPLDNFGAVQFNNGTTVLNGQTESIAGAGSQTMNMENTSRQLLATVSGLGGSSESFSVTRTNNSSASSAAGITIAPTSVTWTVTPGTSGTTGTATTTTTGGQGRIGRHRGVGVWGFVPGSGQSSGQQTQQASPTQTITTPSGTTWTVTANTNGAKSSGQQNTQSVQIVSPGQLQSAQIQQINELLAQLGLGFRISL